MKQPKRVAARKFLLENSLLAAKAAYDKAKNQGIGIPRWAFEKAKSGLIKEGLLVDGRKLKGNSSRQIMLQNRTMPLAEVLAETKRRGKPTTVGSLRTTRYKLRKAGHMLPSWKELGKGSPAKRLMVKLDSKQAAAMREIWQTPRATTEEIQQRLTLLGKKSGLTPIYIAKRKMMDWFPEIDFTPKPKPIKLTPEQEKMIPQFEKLIRTIFWQTITPSLKWSTQALRDYENFAIGRIPWLIKNYDRTRSKLGYYLAQKLRSLKQDYVRTSLQQRMGISREEADILVRIKREKHGGLQDHAKIAEKLKCSKSEVDGLWEAYQVLRRTEGRTGRKEEQ